MGFNSAQQAIFNKVNSDGLTDQQREAVERADARAGNQPTTYSDQFGNTYNAEGFGSDEPEESRGLARGVGDFAVGVAGAVPKAVAGVVSLGSLVPGLNKLADPIAESLMDAGEWIDEQFLSEYQQSINQDMAQAMADSARDLGEDASLADHIRNIGSQGGAAAEFVYDNPSQAIMLAGQAIPYLVGGGVLARGANAAAKGVQVARGTAASRATATGLAPATAGAAGEGLMAGGAVEGDIVGQLRDEGETGYTAGRLAAIPAGVVTSLIGRTGAKVNARLGGADVDTFAAGNATNLIASGPKRGLTRRTAIGGLNEGVEELFQSGSEQAFTNVGTGKGISDDVGSSAVFGAAAGVGMGSVIGALGNSGTDLDAVEAEKLATEENALLELKAEEAAKVAKLQEQKDEAIANEKKAVNRQVAVDFPFPQFKKDREAQQEAEIDDPSTELGQAFEQHLNTLPGIEGTSPDRIKKARTAFIKTYREGQAEALEQDYMFELDARANALQTPVDPNQLELDLDDNFVAPVRPEVKEGQMSLDLGDVSSTAPASDGKPDKPLTPYQAKRKEAKDKKQASIDRAEKLLGPDWQKENSGLSQLLDAPKSFTATKTLSSPFDRRVDEAVKENADANTRADIEASEVLSTPQDADAYARSALGEDWDNANVDLANTLTDGDLAKFKTDVDVLAGAQDVATSVDSASAMLAAPKDLSADEVKVWDVLNRYFLGDMQYAIDEVFAGKPGEEVLQQTNIAKLAGVKNKSNAGKAVERFRSKIVSAQGLVREGSTKAERAESTEQFKHTLRLATARPPETVTDEPTDVDTGIIENTVAADLRAAGLDKTINNKGEQVALSPDAFSKLVAAEVSKVQEDENKTDEDTAANARQDGIDDNDGADEGQVTETYDGYQRRQNLKEGLEASDGNITELVLKRELENLKAEQMRNAKQDKRYTPEEFVKAVQKKVQDLWVPPTKEGTGKYQRTAEVQKVMKSKSFQDAVKAEIQKANEGVNSVDETASQIAATAKAAEDRAQADVIATDRETLKATSKLLEASWSALSGVDVSSFEFLTEKSKIDWMYANRTHFDESLQSAPTADTNLKKKFDAIVRKPDYATKARKANTAKPDEGNPNSYVAGKAATKVVTEKIKKRSFKKPQGRVNNGDQRRNAEVREPIRQSDTQAAQNAGPRDEAGDAAGGSVSNPRPQTTYKKVTKSKLMPTAFETGLFKKTNPTIRRLRADTFVSEEPDANYLSFSTVQDALSHIMRTGNRFEQALAKRLTELAAIGDYRLRIVDPSNPQATLKEKDFEPNDVRLTASERRRITKKGYASTLAIWGEDNPPLGLYSSSGAGDTDNANGVVQLNAVYGIDNNTFLHEMIHAVTAQTVQRSHNGNLKDTLAFDMVLELDRIANAVEAHHKKISDKQLRELIGLPSNAPVDELRATLDAVGNSVDELIAYAFTDSQFQIYLDAISMGPNTIAPVTAWSRFVGAIRKYMDLSFDKGSVKTESALERVLARTDVILGERLSMENKGQNTQSKLEAEAYASALSTGVMFKTMTPTQLRRSQRGVTQTRKWAEKNLGPSSAQFVEDATFIAKAGAKSITFLHQFVRNNREKMPAIGRWYDGMLKAEATRTELRQTFEGIALRARDLSTERLSAVNDVIGSSTFYQKWAYDPKIAGKKVKVDLGMAAKFARLSASEQQLVKEVFAHGENMRQRKIALAKKLGVTGFFTDAALDGPYAPLKRFGDHAAELKTSQLLIAEKAAKAKGASKAVKDKYATMMSDPNHYVLSFFDTPGAAQLFVDANASKFDGFAGQSEKAPDIEAERVGNPEVYEKVMGALKASNDSAMDPAAKKAFRDMVQNMYFQSLDERSARLSGSRRLNRAGYDQDMMRGFLSHARAESSLISQMENGTEINTAFAEAGRETKNDAGTGRDKERQAVYNMVARHYTDTLQQKETPYQDRIAAANSVWMLTSSIGYHVTNATQPVMVTVPRIAGDFADYAGAWASLFKGYGVSVGAIRMTSKMETVIDIEKAPQKYRKLLEHLQQHQLLDLGMEEDLSFFERFNTGYDALNKASDVMGTITHKLYQVARFVEAQNRISAAVSAYDMANKHSAKLSRMKMTPLQYATAVVEDTQGNFSRLDAPLLLKTLPKVMVQYRKYQLLMGWHYANAYKQVRWGSQEEKAVGARTLAYSLSHAALGAGATGVPLLGTAFWLTSFLGSDDEPDDLERWIERNVEDPSLAKMLARGVPSFFGLDMSTKLSQGKIFNPLPYVDFETGEDGAKNIFFGAAAGPAGTTGVNFFRAADYYKNGDIMKGVEYTVPKGIRTAVESYRLATEGYSLKNGDVVVDPREISVGSLLANFVGLPSTAINDLKWTRGQQYELTEYFNVSSGKLRKQYREAHRGRDQAKMASLRREWKDLQDAKDRVRPFFNDERTTLKRQNVLALVKSPRRADKREEKYRRQLATD